MFFRYDANNEEQEAQLTKYLNDGMTIPNHAPCTFCVVNDNVGTEILGGGFWIIIFQIINSKYQSQTCIGYSGWFHRSMLNGVWGNFTRF